MRPPRMWRVPSLEQWQLRLPDDGADTQTIRFRAPDGQSGKLDLYVEKLRKRRLEEGGDDRGR